MPQAFPKYRRRHIANAYKDGWSTEEIFRTYKCSGSSLYRILKEFKIPKRGRGNHRGAVRKLPIIPVGPALAAVTLGLQDAPKDEANEATFRSALTKLLEVLEARNIDILTVNVKQGVVTYQRREDVLVNLRREEPHPSDL